MRSEPTQNTDPSGEPSILPTANSWIRASVSAIPWVGGALDHLLFDKADEIRKRNIESSIDALSKKLKETDDAKIDKAWFTSEEAIQVFRVLAETTQFEPDHKKRKVLGELAAISGTKAHSSDPRKLSVLEQFGRLSFVQIKILEILSHLKPQEREFSGGDINQKGSALWIDNILEAVKAAPGGPFWEGNLQLDVELELMESLNMIRRVQLFTGGSLGYVVSAIGKLAATYLDDSK